MFSDEYMQFRILHAGAREDGASISEQMFQCIWYDQRFSETGLTTDAGKPIRIISPGWWNHQEGPDFKGAQIDFGGMLRTGDVEVHLEHEGWRSHGHHQDSRYDDVILHVVLEQDPPRHPIQTSKGRPIASLLLRRYLPGDLHQISDRMLLDNRAYGGAAIPGRCAAIIKSGASSLPALITLAGEWRMLNKARALRERMDQAGPDQTLYEAFLYACGFSHFKHHFRAIARHLPYDRARQLAQQDPLLLEAAFLQLAGLMPESLPEPVNHFLRINLLRQNRLGGLKSLSLYWRRAGLRPINFPERRLAGAALFVARTAREGLTETLQSIWHQELSPLRRRKAFEALCPAPMGFWAEHCTWTGKELPKPCSPIGPARIRSIIGNVFIPAGLALARREHNREQEENVYRFFTALPPEQENHILRAMIPRVFGEKHSVKLSFQLQQGLLQIHQDWCESNPSCQNCSLLRHLRGDSKAFAEMTD